MCAEVGSGGTSIDLERGRSLTGFVSDAAMNSLARLSQRARNLPTVRNSPERRAAPFPHKHAGRRDGAVEGKRSCSDALQLAQSSWHSPAFTSPPSQPTPP